MHRLKQLLCDELSRQLSANGKSSVRLQAGGDMLWGWFSDLNRSRSFHMAGPNPITYAEIMAYAQATGWPISHRHVEIIVAMDRTFLGHHVQRPDDSKAGVKVLPPISKAPLSAGLFDAMFG